MMMICWCICFHVWILRWSWSWSISLQDGEQMRGWLSPSWDIEMLLKESWFGKLMLKLMEKISSRLWTKNLQMTLRSVLDCIFFLVYLRIFITHFLDWHEESTKNRHNLRISYISSSVEIEILYRIRTCYCSLSQCWDDLFAFSISSHQRVVVLWTLDPAERDALLANEATKRWTSSNQVLVEIACTRSSHDLLLVRQAYHARYKKSLEEDVAYHTTGDFCKVQLLDH